MGLKSYEKKIGENLYVYTQQRLDDVIEFQSAIVSVCGDAVSNLFASGVNAELSGAVLSASIASLVANLRTDSGVKKLIDCANKGGTVYLKCNKGSAPVFLHSHGDAQLHLGEFYNELPEWLVFAIQSQFGPFGESVVRLISGALRKAGTLSGQASASLAT